MNDVKVEELEKNMAELEMELLNVQAEISGLPGFMAEIRMRLEVIEKTLGIKNQRRQMELSH